VNCPRLPLAAVPGVSVGRPATPGNHMLVAAHGDSERQRAVTGTPTFRA